MAGRTVAGDEAQSRSVEERLVAIAARLPVQVRDRVSKLLVSSAQACQELVEVDVVRFEADGSAGSHTLAMWEELAPMVGETVQSVNGLVAIAEETFPPPPEKDVVDDLDAAFGGPDSEVSEVTAKFSPEEEIG